MDARTAIAIGQFVLEAIKDGVPIIEKVIELLRSVNEPEAAVVLAELEAAYAASRERARLAHESLNPPDT